MRIYKKTAGFTLIEVLVAFLVLALSVAVLMKASGAVSRSAIQLKEKTIAQWVAMNKMVELRLAKKVPEVGRSNGEDEMANKSWRWDIEVKKTEFPDLRQVQISVKRADEDKDAAPSATIISMVGKL